MCIEKDVYACLPRNFSAVFLFQLTLYLLKLLLRIFLSFLAMHNFLLSFPFIFSLPSFFLLIC